MVPNPIPPLLWGALWALPTAALAAAALPFAAALALAGTVAALRSRRPAARAGLLALPALLVAATPPGLPPPRLPTDRNLTQQSDGVNAPRVQPRAFSPTVRSSSRANADFVSLISHTYSGEMGSMSPARFANDEARPLTWMATPPTIQRSGR